MINSYCNYISKYILETHPKPGEHHFIATYLVPKLYEIYPLIPDYINPDGTKKIRGDIVFASSEFRPEFGIEVKFEKMHFTKNETNDWLVPTQSKCAPDVFIGICGTGLAIATWHSFRAAYINLVRKKNGKQWSPKRIEKNYSPIRNVSDLKSHLKDFEYYQYTEDQRERISLEKNFTTAIRNLLIAKNQL